MNRPPHNKGYTLIEMMIVLLILSSVTAIVVSSFQTAYSAKQTSHFLEQLQDDLYYTQAVAISRGETTSLTIYPENHEYVVYGKNKKLLIRRTFPSHIVFKGGTLGYKVVYLANGNVQKPGTLFINTNFASYKVVVQLGKGRFYVAKL
ncbi:competence type IV pilus minor pilin ComGD [Bacillus taeanensis]|uniref:Competence protein comGD n=1 Tax=Bacillus taeanensis TaxID=273032 RepID=A0A366XYD2_9BACI|nr:competence type IV pilus minor pilin ComGD [Bacillus taeanensis]RBW70578.1 competence protein comGD [Bacillus taeanensis]